MEAFAYQEGIYMEKFLKEEAFWKAFWKAFWERIGAQWDEYWSNNKAKWRKMAPSARLSSLVRQLPPGYGLTMSVPSTPKRQYSYCSPDRTWERNGFEDAKSAVEAADEHMKYRSRATTTSPRPEPEPDTGTNP